MIALIAGLAAFVAANAALGALHGLACGTSQFMNALLRHSPFALPIKVIGWFGAAWAGMSAFDAMGGF